MESASLPEPVLGLEGESAALAVRRWKTWEHAMDFDLETGSVAPTSKSRSLRPDMEILRLPELRLEGRERRSRRSALKSLGKRDEFRLRHGERSSHVQKVGV